MSGFDSFVGNDALISRLKRDIKNGKLTHAYIIEGAKGCGKMTLAKLICKALSCPSDDPPCEECILCSKIERLQTPDIKVVTPEKDRVQIGVDVIRAVREDAAYAPIELAKRFFIIPDAELMTDQSQNALLKILEEPPAHVMFLILTQNTEDLLTTVRSRAPLLRISSLSDNLIEEKLISVSEKAKALKSSDPDAFFAAIKLSRGSLGMALQLTDPQNSDESLKLYRKAERFIELMVNRRDSVSELEFYEHAVGLSTTKEREALTSVYGLLADAFRDMINAKLSKSPSPIFFTSADKAMSMAESFTLSRLISLTDIFTEARESLSRNTNINLVLSHTASAVMAAGRTK